MGVRGRVDEMLGGWEGVRVRDVGCVCVRFWSLALCDMGDEKELGRMGDCCWCVWWDCVGVNKWF